MLTKLGGRETVAMFIFCLIFLFFSFVLFVFFLFSGMLTSQHHVVIGVLFYFVCFVYGFSR